MKDYRPQWVKEVGKHLQGRTIKSVRYLTDKEMESLDWYASAVVLILDNGQLLWASQDDEGNGPGAIFTTIEELPVIPVV